MTSLNANPQRQKLMGVTHREVSLTPATSTQENRPLRLPESNLWREYQIGWNQYIALFPLLGDIHTFFTAVARSLLISKPVSRVHATACYLSIAQRIRLRQKNLVIFRLRDGERLIPKVMLVERIYLDMDIIGQITRR